MQAQIRITKTPQISQIISSIQSQYVLLDDVDIIKMALSNQYHSMQKSMDETEYLTSSSNNKKRLDQALDQSNDTSKKFTNLKQLANEIGFDY